MENLCNRWRILKTDNAITIKDLPAAFVSADSHQNAGIEYDPGITLAEMNKVYILQAMEHFPSKREAAKALGITIKTLYNRLHDYGIFDQYSMHTAPSEDHSLHI